MKPKLPLTKEVDPFFGLKYIAYCRTGLTINEDDVDEEAMIQFAKWQICKVRGILWNDPIWDSYTAPELLVEFFAIKFDESEELRQKFEATVVSVKAKDLDWFERMERKHAEDQKKGKIKEGEVEQKPEVEFEPTPPVDFEDKF